MRTRLLQLLRCPICVVPLDLEIFAYNGDEIVEGVLRCQKCGAGYPIIERIPRMLPDDLAGEMRALNRDFFARHPGLLPRAGATDGGSESARDLRRTFRSFSFQWNTFGDMYGFWEENFLDYVHPLTPEFFAGKLGCDAGCGFGRHLNYAARYGAEMVGLDLSEAVLAAYRNNRDNRYAHVVQGDIYRPPFARGTFDFIYSIGVLHHLPDPERAFCALAPYVKPDGTLFAWIYGPRHGIPAAGLVDGQVVRRFRNNESWRVLGRVPPAIPSGLDTSALNGRRPHPVAVEARR